MSSTVGSDSGTQPLIFKKDTLLEAKDAYNTWYPAKVLAVKDDKILVHFCNWSSRYDTWYPKTSDSLRALKLVSNTTLSKMKAAQNEHLPKSSNVSLDASSSSTSFPIGSYVMAGWRNQFEYLAEVLAHRHRQGGKFEYRLRYVWDNVIEWTPVSRLRKATQFEIDYVLKFCREHGGEGSGKPVSEFPPKSSNRSGRSSSVSTSLVTTPPTFATRSQTRKKDSLELNSCPTKVARSSNQSVTTTSNPKGNSPVLLPDGVQQDGMVYDKAVLQFHEACRRRRELKRKAIAEDQPSTVESIGLTPRETPVACTLKTNRIKPPLSLPPDSRMGASQSLEPPLKVAKFSPTHDPGSVHSSSPRSPLASELENPVTTSNDMDVQESKVLANQSTENSPETGTSPAPSTSLSKNILKTPTSPNLKLEAETKPSPSIPATKRPTAEWNTLPPTPVIYPCPHCPRKLRHSKLLAAHIANYHKSVRDASKPSPSGTSPARVNRQTSATTELTRPSSSVASVKPEVTNSSAPRTCLDSRTTIKLARLLACFPCDTRSAVSDTQSGLVQCQNCLSWMHQKCCRTQSSFGVDTKTTADSARNFFCDGCMLATRSARHSRGGELHLKSLRNADASRDKSSTQRITHELLPATMDLLNWCYHLRPLVSTGWNILNGTKLPTPSPPNSGHQMTKPRQTLPKSVPQTRIAPTAVAKLKLSSEAQERPTNNEQVNRLYMELRASMTDPDSEQHTSRLSLAKELAEEPPTTDSEIHSICWSLCEETDGVDGSSMDANISNQVLSGFLQDLGPNVISDLVDLGSDAIAGDVEGPDVDCFLRRHAPETSTSQQSDCQQDSTPCTSVSDTPTKGLGPLLSSPGGVATLLHAAISNTLPISNRLDFIHPPFGADAAVSISGDHAGSKSANIMAPVIISTSCTPAAVLSPPLVADKPSSSLQSIEYPVNDPFMPTPSFHTSPSGHSPLDTTTTTSLYPDMTEANKVVCNSTCPHMASSGVLTGTNITAAAEHLPTSTSACLRSADADWLSDGMQNAKSPRFFMLAPFTSTNTSSHVPGRSLPTNSSILDDALGSVNPFSLDMVSDTLTPDEVSVANTNLNQLDQFVLLPLERALAVMESQLDFITKEVDVLEQDQDHLDTLTRLPVEQTRFAGDTAFESDSFHLSSSSNSSFGSSPSFSLSPYEMRLDEVPVSSELPSTNPLDLSSSQIVRDSTLGRSHAAKQAARQLYRLTMFRRSQSQMHLKSRSVRHDVPSHKGLGFSRHSPTTSHPLNDRL